ncbi:hypothetical protein Tco_0215981 [Tanacetum coccineum]
MTYPCHWFSEQVGLAGDLGSTNDVLIPLVKMGDANLTMEEYIELEAEKACKRDFPAIFFDDPLATNHKISSEPTVSPLDDNEIDFRISFDESDDEDYTFIYDENSFSCKLIPVDNLKTNSENDNIKVNVSSGDIVIEQSKNGIDTNIDAQSHEFDEDFETNHDIHHKSFNMKDYFMTIKVCMTRSSTKELFTPFKDPEQEFRSSRKHFKTLSLDESRSSNFDLFSDQEEYSEEEVAETMAETMEQYMSKTRADYGSGIARPKIEEKDSFELNGQFLKELRDNTFSGLDHEDANEHIEKEVILFYNGLEVLTRQILDSKGAIPSKTAADAKVAIQEMAEYSQKWHNGTSRTRSTKTSDGLAAIQAQLNNLGREIKKVNENVYAAQVGCEQCKGPHYTKYCPLKEEGKTLEKAYYTQFGAPFQGGGYRATTLGFYQRNNANPSYQERRQSMEETLSKFMGESAKRHEENSNLIKEIRPSIDAAIRNQGASIKTLEIQIGQMSKVLLERGFGSLPSSTKTNMRDHVKSILTTVEADANSIRHMGSS